MKISIAVNTTAHKADLLETLMNAGVVNIGGYESIDKIEAVTGEIEDTERLRHIEGILAVEIITERGAPEDVVKKILSASQK